MNLPGLCGWVTSHEGEGRAMPKVIQIPLPEEERGEGARFVGQQHRDERLFRLAYAEDISREFRKALRTARVAFLVRMAAI